MTRSLFRWAVALAVSLAVASASPLESASSPFSGPNPWPAIRKERIGKLLPEAMRRAGVDAWVIVCRENDNDPLAAHVGGENGGGAAAFLFLLSEAGVRAVALSPAGEATALKDVGLHDEVVVLERGTTVWTEAAKRLRAAGPKKIAVNSSAMTVADGLSHTQRVELEKALGADLAARLVPSEELVVEWLSVKLPQEVEILRRAATLTAALELEAYATVVPGKTRDSDVARFLKKRMRELGVEDSWAPDQNPNVNSGPDRGHSHATDRVIQPGDFIQTDFGIKVHGVWCTDVQRFAYVLAPGQMRRPADAEKKWENARKGSRVALAAMKPGARGYDVDKAQRDWMKEAGSEWVMWGTGHPVGYWAHDVGPALSGAQREGPPSGSGVRTLRPGQTFAFDGFYSWKLPGGADAGTKTISVEEMAVVTPTGAEYLIPPQEDLVLIRSPIR
ncbi:MAG: M24 family metallopeptidase [Acidobacteriota bacterium]